MVTEQHQRSTLWPDCAWYYEHEQQENTAITKIVEQFMTGWGQWKVILRELFGKFAIGIFQFDARRTRHKATL